MLYLILSSEVEIIDLEKGEFGYSPLLKIGYTKNIDSRFDSYELHNVGCKLLKTREGGTDLENYMHKYFSKYKYPNREEWFYYSQEIIDNFQTLEIGEGILTKHQYIEEMKRNIRRSIPSVEEFKDKYLRNLLNELEREASELKIEFDREYYKSFVINYWRNMCNIEIK